MTAQFSKALTAISAAAAIALLAAVFGGGTAGKADKPDGKWREMNAEAAAWLAEREQAELAAAAEAAQPDVAAAPSAPEAVQPPGGGGGAAAEISAVPREDGKINLNTATAEQLDELPGIGKAKAKAIVEYREQHGPFQHPDEVMSVKGIGPAIYEKIKTAIVVEK